jgi:hypothetical protein
MKLNRKQENDKSDMTMQICVWEKKLCENIARKKWRQRDKKKQTVDDN